MSYFQSRNRSITSPIYELSHRSGACSALVPNLDHPCFVHTAAVTVATRLTCQRQVGGVGGDLEARLAATEAARANLEALLQVAEGTRRALEERVNAAESARFGLQGRFTSSENARAVLESRLKT